jgi:hypothetical protein
MRNVRKLKNAVVLSFLLTAVIVPFNASAMTQLDAIVANAITDGDIALIRNLLSELEPKATAVCLISEESVSRVPSECGVYSAYVNDLNQALMMGEG